MTRCVSNKTGQVWRCLRLDWEDKWSSEDGWAVEDGCIGADRRDEWVRAVSPVSSGTVSVATTPSRVPLSAAGSVRAGSV